MRPPVLDAPTAAFRLALCTGVGESEGRPALRIDLGSSAGGLDQAWVPLLAGVPIRVGDRVLLAPVEDDPGWVAVGALAATPSPAPAVEAASPAPDVRPEGAVSAGENRGRDRAADGAPVLDIRVVEGRTFVRFPARDVVLECEGSFEVRSGEALRLEAKDYALTVSGGAQTEAGGKVRVEAAEQEMRSRAGPMRLKAEQNMVVRGRFILLNTEEDKWS